MLPVLWCSDLFDVSKSVLLSGLFGEGVDHNHSLQNDYLHWNGVPTIYQGCKTIEIYCTVFAVSFAGSE